MIKRLIFGLALIFSLPLWAEAATKYVSPTGTEAWANCTTSASPCAVSTARTNAATGDVILFVDGTYTGGLDPNTNGSCTDLFDPDSTKIVWKAEHQYQAILTGNNSIITTTNVFSDNNCNVIDGFTIKVPDQPNTTGAVHVSGTRNEIRNNLVYYDGTLVPTTGFAHADGIRARGLTWVHHNTIRNVTVGVIISGNGGASNPHASIVEYNTISDVDKGDLEDADCFVGQQNSSVSPDYTGAEIRYNECSRWYDDGADMLSVNNIRVHNNYFHDSFSLALGHGGCLKLGYGATGNRFYANRCYGIAGLAYGIDAQGAESALVYGNVVIGGTYGIFLNPSTGTGSNNTFYNNTIVAGTWAVFLAHNAVTGTVLRNNIISGGSGIDMRITAGGTVTGSYNLFEHTTSTVEGTYTGSNELVGDPLFISPSRVDYRPQVASPAFRSGIWWGNECADARGRPCFPGQINRGAFQTGSGDPAGARVLRQ